MRLWGWVLVASGLTFGYVALSPLDQPVVFGLSLSRAQGLCASRAGSWVGWLVPSLAVQCERLAGQSGQVWAVAILGAALTAAGVVVLLVPRRPA